MAMVTPMKAIRAKCIDCSGGEKKEVRECPIRSYRMGKRPKVDNLSDDGS